MGITPPPFGDIEGASSRVGGSHASPRCGQVLGRRRYWEKEEVLGMEGGKEGEVLGKCSAPHLSRLHHAPALMRWNQDEIFLKVG